MRNTLRKQADKCKASLFLIIIFCLISPISVYSQIWETVGDSCFTTAGVSENSFAIDKNGVPYAANNDGASITVMKFDGSKWVTVGSPAFAPGEAYSITLAIDTAGTPYVAYADYQNDWKATVMKYNGFDWVMVGKQGFSANEALDISLAINNYGEPYVVYADATTASRPATVMKYDGSDWALVGSAGFSALNVMHPTITFDSKATPYISFFNFDRTYPISYCSVMKFDGAAWKFVGDTDFVAVVDKYVPTIAIGNADTPYIAFTSGIAPFAAVAMKYNGANWVQVGSNEASPTEAHHVSMAFNNDKIPYIAFEDFTTARRRVTVKKCESGTWVNAGNTSFSGDSVRQVRIAIDNANTPYVSYYSETKRKPTVLKLSSTVGTPNMHNPATTSLSVSPNPNQGQFTITIPSVANENALVSVTDITGRQVAAFNAETNNATSVSLSLPAGIYLVNVRTQSVNLHQKIVIE